MTNFNREEYINKYAATRAKNTAKGAAVGGGVGAIAGAGVFLNRVRDLSGFDAADNPIKKSLKRGLAIPGAKGMVAITAGIGALGGAYLGGGIGAMRKTSEDKNHESKAIVAGLNTAVGAGAGYRVAKHPLNSALWRVNTRAEGKIRNTKLWLSGKFVSDNMKSQYTRDIEKWTKIKKRAPSLLKTMAKKGLRKHTLIGAGAGIGLTGLQLGMAKVLDRGIKNE
jgi:hypothetical protein